MSDNIDEISELHHSDGMNNIMHKESITKDYLDTAIKLVTGPRSHAYGDKVINHNNIAKLWGAYLDTNITAHDAAIMLGLLKVARAKFGNPSSDTYIDAAAYMAIAGECKHKEDNNGSS